MRTVKIIGVGAPHGDDWLGWELAERLRASERLTAWGERVSIALHDNPSAALAQAWRNTGLVILLDSARTGAAPGTLHHLDAQQLQNPLSTSGGTGTGVMGAVRLAVALEALPESLEFYGVEADTQHAALCLSDTVYACLPALVEKVAARVDEYLRVETSVAMDDAAPE